MVELSLCCLTQCSFLSCESNKYIFRPLVLYIWLQFITLCTKNKYNSKIRFTIDSTDKRMKIHAWSIRKYWISMELCHHQYWLHWGVFWPQICQIFNSKFKISLIVGKLQPCGVPQAEVYPQEQEWPIDWSSGGTTIFKTWWYVHRNNSVSNFKRSKNWQGRLIDNRSYFAVVIVDH